MGVMKRINFRKGKWKMKRASMFFPSPPISIFAWYVDNQLKPTDGIYTKWLIRSPNQLRGWQDGDGLATC